jgi:hypothetical protein
VMRSAHVLRFFPERQPSHRLRDLSEGYRVASEAFSLACDLGCSGDIADGLWSICEREAKAYETKAGGVA